MAPIARRSTRQISTIILRRTRTKPQVHTGSQFVEARERPRGRLGTWL